MNPARLDTKISIYRKVPTRDAAGAASYSRQLIASPWAQKSEQGSRLFRSYGVLHAETSTTFRIRFIDGIQDSDLVIVCGGVDYKLTAPAVEIEGRRAWLLIQARRVA